MQSEFPCRKCGGKLAYKPGSTTVKCRYCSHLNDVPKATADDRAAAIYEQDLEAALAAIRNADSSAAIEETKTVKCSSCAAEFSWDERVSAEKCPFCGSDIVTDPQINRHFRPQALIPFQIDRNEAQERLQDWLGSLLLAPKDMKEAAYTEGKLVGMYVPYWTFDAQTVSDYRGERGNFMDNRVYDEDVVRSEWEIEWKPVSGTVSRFFDDILVLATGSLPPDFAQNLKDWDLDLLEPYREEYLAGYRSEVYQMNLEIGYDHAREYMKKIIHEKVRRDIRGDQQRVNHIRVSYQDLRFKHILLPVWINAYRYGGQSYHFLVNGQTGEVQGERPVLWTKVGSIIFIVLILAWVFAFYEYFDGR